ncbi:MAG: hypothetical protein AB7D37_06145 [Desulfovibrio sp.]
MGAAKQTMLVNVGKDTDCPTSLLEFPRQDVDPGEAVTVRVWAPDPALLTGLRLDAGLTSLGPGTPNVWPGQTTCKYFDFEGDGDTQQFDYPVTGISRVIAFSPLYGLSDAGVLTTLAPAGADVTGLFHRRGYACLVPAAGLPGLYGTVHAVGVRAPYCREFFWTAPADPRGAQWFFLWEDGELAHRFSLTLSEDPDDTSVCYTDVKIRVIDRRTAGAVLGASVVLNGVAVGQTDQRYGFVKVFRHLSGTFPIVVTKSGYTASNADSYTDNDSITIAPAGGEVRVKIGGYA